MVLLLFKGSHHVLFMEVRLYLSPDNGRDSVAAALFSGRALSEFHAMLPGASDNASYTCCQGPQE